MSLKKSILAAVGELPQDDVVLMRAAEIAAAHQARLTIVHVIDFLGTNDLGPTDTVPIRQQAEFAAREKIGDAVARHAADIADIDIRIETGSPALRLIGLCEDLGPDLIVMRTHQEDSLITKLVGSTTDRVIRAASAPVLVVKRPVTGAYQRAVVATDGSDGATVTLSFVAALLPETALHLVRTVQIPPRFEEAMLRVGTGQGVLAAHRDALIRNARDHLRQISTSLTGRVPRTTTRVVTGDPAKVLLRAARSPKVDLIALGSGRASLIRRALIGSVTRRVLRDAACDVLICRPQEGGE